MATRFQTHTNIQLGLATAEIVHVFLHHPSIYMYIYFASTHNVLLPWEVGGVSCTRKMVPVGEERAKLVTPLTDIQLLHPVTATMHAREGDRRGMRGKGRAGEEEEEEEVRKKERMKQNGGWGMKQAIGRREKIMSITVRRNKERGGGRGREEGR